MAEWKYDDLRRFANSSNASNKEVIENVRILDISNEQLDEIPQEVFLLTSLKILYCSKNNISTIPPKIEQLVNLEKIYLCYNNLETIPEEVCNLKKLKQIHIFNNKIHKLPTNISQLTNLVQLDITNNNIENIDEVVKLDKLERFYGRNNKIKHIGFTKLNNSVEHFDISSNGLQKDCVKANRHDTHLIY